MFEILISALNLISSANIEIIHEVLDAFFDQSTKFENSNKEPASKSMVNE